jgi:hypothetical protein
MVTTPGLLRLRTAQLAALARQAAGDDITAFVAQAHEHHPEIAAALGGELAAHVGRIRDLGFAVGLHRSADIHRFVDLGLIMGWPWLQSQRQAITERLADWRIFDISRRLDAVFERALLSLEGRR